MNENVQRLHEASMTQDDQEIEKKSEHNNDELLEEIIKKKKPLLKNKAFLTLLVLLIVLFLANLFESNISQREQAAAKTATDNANSEIAVLEKQLKSQDVLNEEISKIRINYQELKLAANNLNGVMNNKADMQSLQDLKIYVNQSIAETEDRLTKLIRRVSEIEAGNKIIKQKSEKLTKIQNSRTQRAPFTLVTIDYWSGTVYAGIDLDGKIELLSMGEERLGWKVVSVDYKNSFAKFSHNKTKKTVIMKL